MDNDWSSDWPSDYWSSDTDLSSLNIDAVYDNPDIGFLFSQLPNTDEETQESHYMPADLTESCHILESALFRPRKLGQKQNRTF